MGKLALIQLDVTHSVILLVIVSIATGTTDPSNLACSALNSTSISITWTQASDVTVLGYHIDVSRVDGLRIEPKIPTVDMGDKTYDNYDISGLGNYGTYGVVIHSYTGSGNLTDYTVNCTTDEDVPAYSTTKFECAGIGSSSITCSWDDMDQIYWNGVKQGWRLQYLMSTNISSIYEMSVAANTLTATATNLRYGTSYVLLLNAYTSIGQGTKYITTTAYTSGISTTTEETVNRYYCYEAVPGFIEFGWEEMPCTIYSGTIGALFLIVAIFIAIFACQACCSKQNGGGGNVEINMISEYKNSAGGGKNRHRRRQRDNIDDNNYSDDDGGTDYSDHEDDDEDDVSEIGGDDAEEFEEDGDEFNEAKTPASEHDTDDEEREDVFSVARTPESEFGDEDVFGDQSKPASRMKENGMGRRQQSGVSIEGAISSRQVRLDDADSQLGSDSSDSDYDSDSQTDYYDDDEYDEGGGVVPPLPLALRKSRNNRAPTAHPNRASRAALKSAHPRAALTSAHPNNARKAPPTATPNNASKAALTSVHSSDTSESKSTKLVSYRNGSVNDDANKNKTAVAKSNDNKNNAAKPKEGSKKTVAATKAEVHQDSSVNAVKDTTKPSGKNGVDSKGELITARVIANVQEGKATANKKKQVSIRHIDKKDGGNVGTGECVSRVASSIGDWDDPASSPEPVSLPPHTSQAMPKGPNAMTHTISKDKGAVIKEAAQGKHAVHQNTKTVDISNDKTAQPTTRQTKRGSGSTTTTTGITSEWNIDDIHDGNNAILPLSSGAMATASSNKASVTKPVVNSQKNGASGNNTKSEWDDDVFGKDTKAVSMATGMGNKHSKIVRVASPTFAQTGAGELNAGQRTRPNNKQGMTTRHSLDSLRDASTINAAPMQTTAGSGRPNTRSMSLTNANALSNANVRNNAQLNINMNNRQSTSHQNGVANQRGHVSNESGRSKGILVRGGQNGELNTRRNRETGKADSEQSVSPRAVLGNNKANNKNVPSVTIEMGDMSGRGADGDTNIQHGPADTSIDMVHLPSDNTPSKANGKRVITKPEQSQRAWAMQSREKSSMAGRRTPVQQLHNLPHKPREWTAIEIEPVMETNRLGRKFPFLDVNTQATKENSDISKLQNSNVPKSTAKHVLSTFANAKPTTTAKKPEHSGRKTKDDNKANAADGKTGDQVFYGFGIGKFRKYASAWLNKVKTKTVTVKTAPTVWN